MPIRQGYRVSKIEIDLPKQGSMPYIQLRLEGIDVDDAGNIVAVRPDADRIVVSAMDIATETVTVGDLSPNGLEAQEIVRQFAILLVNQKHGTTFDPGVGGSGKAMFT